MASSCRMFVGTDLGGVAKASAAFADFAEAHAVPADIRRGLNVALDELLTNTVSYGLVDDGGEVIVDVELHPDRLIVTLSDNGRPFNPFGRSAPDTTLSVEERPIGGLGIHLVRKLVDDVSYQRSAGHNVVVLTQRLAGKATAGHRGGESMEITTRSQGDATIVALAGSLDSGTSPQAQQAIDAIIAGGARTLAVDFSALDYISSAGLRVLLSTAKQLSAKGGALRTFGLNDTIREVFDISGFSTILAVFPGEAEALQGF